MPDTDTPAPAHGAIPDDYQEVLYWSLSEKTARVITLQVFGVLLFILFGYGFFGLAISLGNLPSSFNLGLSEIGLSLAGIVLTGILHELAHGWAMQMFGARPSYGILWKKLMFYATAPGFGYRRNDYIVVALAPLVSISILVVIGMGLLHGTLWVALLAICGTINAGGAVGDIWVTVIVLRYAAGACIMDERDAVRVFLPKP